MGRQLCPCRQWRSMGDAEILPQPLGIHRDAEIHPESMGIHKGYRDLLTAHEVCPGLKDRDKSEMESYCMGPYMGKLHKLLRDKVDQIRVQTLKLASDVAKRGKWLRLYPYTY
ncbi:hypothetical protein TURU_052330 [Turdus rufiventris]|nr:hypothetical protein TURU_052330 [Turdus rufiventris]